MSVRIDRVAFAAALARLDINCKKLVELSGVSRVTVTAVKNGKSCSTETADKLAQVLGRDIIRKESCKQKSSPKMKNFEEGEKGNNKPSLQKRIFCRLNEP